MVGAGAADAVAARTVFSVANDRSSQPRIAWPVKVLAVAAVGGMLFAGYREATGGGDGGDRAEPGKKRAAAVAREGSERTGAADPRWAFGPFPERYRITYRVVVTGAETTEDVSVIAPFDSRTVSYRGRDAKGAPLDERELTFGLLATRANGQTSALQVPPALAGPRPAAAIPGAEEAGLVTRREVREVAGRRCQVWRTGGALAATTFVAPGGDDYIDLCIDADGLLLEEWQVNGGVGIRHRVAVAVRTGGVEPEDLAQLPRDVTLTVNQGGGSIVETEPTARPVGPFLDTAGPPSGFTLRGRFTVVPPQAALLEGAERGKTVAAVTDVYVRGTDAIIIERGGVLDLSDPWAADDAFPDVDLGPGIGTGELVPGRGGSEVRALLGSGRYLRVSGSVDLDALVEVARSLVAVDDGAGIGFSD